MEQTRISALLMHWESASQTSSQCNHSSPPTPSRRKHNSQDRQLVKQGSLDKPRSPDVRRYLNKGQGRPSQPTSPASPPSRRSHSTPPSTYTCNQSEDKQEKLLYDNRTGSPIKRSPIPANTWKTNQKIPQFTPKPPGQKVDPCEDQRCYSPNLLTQREIHQSYGVSQEYIETTRETSSQITYNPTFQSCSPSHVPVKQSPIAQTLPPQPYIAQIITYPMSQQAVAYQNATQKYISQTPTYQPQPIQQPQPGPSITQQRYPGRAQPGIQQTSQQSIYYIAPTAMTPPPLPPEQILTPKQQTAIHLQQYVAMKQAQQAMGYNQRIPGGQTIHDFGQYCPSPNESPGNYNRKLYDRTDESYSLNFMTVGRQPISQKAVLQSQTLRQTSPGIAQLQQSVAVSPNVQQYATLIRSSNNAGGFQNKPGCTASLGRSQSLNQKDTITAERYGISSPTTVISPQNNVAIRNNLCQSLNIVTQKTVGQIVPSGNQDLVIYQNLTGATAVVDQRVIVNSSIVNTDASGKIVQDNKGRENFFTGTDMCQVGQTSEQKSVSKPHLGSNIVGRQVYYSQVVSANEQKAGNSSFMVSMPDSSLKKGVSDISVKGGRPPLPSKNNSLENTTDYL